MQYRVIITVNRYSTICFVVVEIMKSAKNSQELVFEKVIIFTLSNG